MNIKSIHLHGLFCHDATDIQFPSSGIVLVTGANGSGKSSLIETVAVAGWGKTLRGTEPWEPGRKNCSARVEVTVGDKSKEMNIRRARLGKKIELGWDSPGDEGQSFETVTKAQAALENIIGAWDVWRRCSVFSSHDAAHFTRATDGERKRLLEEVLGMDRFDEALTACRADLRQANTQRATAETEVALMTERMRSAEKRLIDAQVSLQGIDASTGTGTVVDTVPTEAKLVKLRTMQSEGIAELRKVRESQRAADGAGAVSLAQVAQIERMLKTIQAETCPTCAQPIPVELRTNLIRQSNAAAEAASFAVASAKEAVAGSEGLVKDLEDELAGLSDQISKLASAVTAAKDQARRAAELSAFRARTVKNLESAASDVSKLKELMLTAQQANETATNTANVLEACEQVLGLKGVRSQVLGKALGGIEAVANSWLQRLIGGDLTLRLLPYSEKKTGGVADSISIQVNGAGGGNGYNGSSSGERRRLDVAILLALAEVASAAAGAPAGTLWFDEVFDSLDSDGVERAGEVLRALSAHRCVVVISHSADVVRNLQPDLHLQMEAGKVTVL